LLSNVVEEVLNYYRYHPRHSQIHYFHYLSPVQRLQMYPLMFVERESGALDHEGQVKSQNLSSDFILPLLHFRNCSTHVWHTICGANDFSWFPSLMPK
jgi:hypothetical protein